MAVSVEAGGKAVAGEMEASAAPEKTIARPAPLEVAAGALADVLVRATELEACTEVAATNAESKVATRKIVAKTMADERKAMSIGDDGTANEAVPKQLAKTIAEGKQAEAVPKETIADAPMNQQRQEARPVSEAASVLAESVATPAHTVPPAATLPLEGANLENDLAGTRAPAEGTAEERSGDVATTSAGAKAENVAGAKDGSYEMEWIGAAEDAAGKTAPLEFAIGTSEEKAAGKGVAEEVFVEGAAAEVAFKRLATETKANVATVDIKTKADAEKVALKTAALGLHVDVSAEEEAAKAAAEEAIAEAAATQAAAEAVDVEAGGKAVAGEMDANAALKEPISKTAPLEIAGGAPADVFVRAIELEASAEVAATDAEGKVATKDAVAKSMMDEAKAMSIGGNGTANEAVPKEIAKRVAEGKKAETAPKETIANAAMSEQRQARPVSEAASVPAQTATTPAGTRQLLPEGLAPRPDDAAAPLLRPGASARLRGLRARPELNGEHVRLETYDEIKGRWKVARACGSLLNVRISKLEPCSQAHLDEKPTLSAGGRRRGEDEEEEPLFLQPGARVRVVGLKWRSDLNGQQGTVVEFAKSDGRWKVWIEGAPRTLMMLAANLVLEGMCDGSGDGVVATATSSAAGAARSDDTAQQFDADLVLHCWREKVAMVPACDACFALEHFVHRADFSLVEQEAVYFAGWLAKCIVAGHPTNTDLLRAAHASTAPPWRMTGIGEALFVAFEAGLCCFDVAQLVEFAGACATSQQVDAQLFGAIGNEVKRRAEILTPLDIEGVVAAFAHAELVHTSMARALASVYERSVGDLALEAHTLPCISRALLCMGPGTTVDVGSQLAQAATRHAAALSIDELLDVAASLTAARGDCEYHGLRALSDAATKQINCGADGTCLVNLGTAIELVDLFPWHRPLLGGKVSAAARRTHELICEGGVEAARSELRVDCLGTVGSRCFLRRLGVRRPSVELITRVRSFADAVHAATTESKEIMPCFAAPTCAFICVEYALSKLSDGCSVQGGFARGGAKWTDRSHRRLRGTTTVVHACLATQLLEEISSAAKAALLAPEELPRPGIAAAAASAVTGSICLYATGGPPDLTALAAVLEFRAQFPEVVCFVGHAGEDQSPNF